MTMSALLGVPPDAMTPEVTIALLGVGIVAFTAGFAVGEVRGILAVRAIFPAETRARLGMKPPVSQGEGPTRKARA